jgi:zinc protease
VGDTSLAELTPELEKRFGTWKGAGTPAGTKGFAAPAATQSRIILIDRPQSPQSMILAGQVLPKKGTDDNVALGAANDVIGGSASSRLSLDLREKRNWAYYVGTQVSQVREAMPLLVFAPVQTDQTGPSIAAIRADMAAYPGTTGTSADELGKVVNGLMLSLPGSFETSQELLGAIQRLTSLGRPDDFYTKLPGRYRALKAADLDAAAKGVIDPAKLVWVVIGDAKLVRPQLEQLGLPIEMMEMK